MEVKKPNGGKTHERYFNETIVEAGVHFGHQTRRWNPKMAEYIYTERNGIYIIDLQKSVGKVDELTKQFLILQLKVVQFFSLVQRNRHRMQSKQKQNVAECSM